MGGAGVRAVVPERVALLFSYDGTGFSGYARQPDPRLHTVEDALMEALVEAGVAGDRDALRWATGSRTDRGVSARENVVAFDSEAPAARVPRAVGGRVDDLWPSAALRVDETFDPRRAELREYRYFLSGSWTRGEARRLEAVLQQFVGRHDFSAFCRREEGRDPVRRVDAVVVEDGAEGVVVRVMGGAFLWQQVRRMMAAALAVLDGTVEAGRIDAALKGEAEMALMPAASEPLVLWHVRYPGLRFVRAPDVWGRVQAKFEVARSAAWARAALYRGLADGEA